MKEAYFERLMEEKDKGIGLFLKYHNTLCFPSKILQSSQRKLKQYLCKLLKGRQRVVRYFWKRRIELKTCFFVFWQKRKLTEKIISNNERYINGDGSSKSVFWVTQIGRKWGFLNYMPWHFKFLSLNFQTIYPKIWAKPLPKNEKSPLTTDVRGIVNKTSLLKLSKILATPATNKKTKRK